MAAPPDRPVVEVPARADDQPVWSRVGVIAAVGFVIGIAWPRLANVQLGPEPPASEMAALVTSASAEPVTSAPAPASAAPSAEPAPEGPKPVVVQTVIVRRTPVLSCRDGKGKPQEDCDRPKLDSVLVPRLEQLAKCPSAMGLSGKLSVGFDVDFEKNRLRILRGKSTTLPQSTLAGIWECAGEGLDKLQIDGIEHKHGRYTVFYGAYFYPPGQVIDESRFEEGEGAPDTTAPSVPEPTVIGTAQIVYDTVLVRDAPKTGKVVARLVRGTGVQILRKDGTWYRIRFVDREGWVYRGAIGQ